MIQSFVSADLEQGIKKERKQSRTCFPLSMQQMHHKRVKLVNLGCSIARHCCHHPHISHENNVTLVIRLFPSIPYLSTMVVVKHNVLTYAESCIPRGLLCYWKSRLCRPVQSRHADSSHRACGGCISPPYKYRSMESRERPFHLSAVQRC